MARKTREPQYNILLEKRAEKGIESLGLMTNQPWDDDPHAPNIHAGAIQIRRQGDERPQARAGSRPRDAFGTRIVLPEAGELTAIDFDPVFVDDVNQRMNPKWPFTCSLTICSREPSPQYDRLYTLDVLEYIQPKDEQIPDQHGQVNGAAWHTLLRQAIGA